MSRRGETQRGRVVELPKRVGMVNSGDRGAVIVVVMWAWETKVSLSAGERTPIEVTGWCDLMQLFRQYREANWIVKAW